MWEAAKTERPRERDDNTDMIRGDSDMNISTKQFQILTDADLVWDFLTDIYDRKNGSGVAAPFFEYALQSSWMDRSYCYLDRFWLDGDRVVAFVFYEAPVTDIFFSVRRGYEFLADGLVDYAVSAMPDFGGRQRLVLFNGQEYLKAAAAKRGFVLTEEYEDRHFDFRNELNHPLPEGYHFVDPKDADGLKLAKLLWYGFGHGDEGPFEGWDREDDSFEWTPAKSYKGVIGPMTAPAPHSTHEYDVIIADENGEYVCFSGMWWVPENKLAYMEPLCTHPDHRRKGLAAAALSRHYHRMKALGATHMTGGGDPFYEKLGYGKGLHWTKWKREEKQAEAPLTNPCRAGSEDAAEVALLACELWPEHSLEEMTEEFASLLARKDAAVFLYREQDKAAGFAQCQLRHDYVEGTQTSPVGYLEGIYVRESARRQGVARKLLLACESWAKAQGCAEFASDCELDNTESQRFHRSVGFEEANRIVAYVKKL